MKKLIEEVIRFFLVIFVASIGLLGITYSLSFASKYYFFTIPLALVWMFLCVNLLKCICDCGIKNFATVSKNSLNYIYQATKSTFEGVFLLGKVILEIIFVCVLIYLAYCFFSWIGATGVIIILLILILLK